MLEAMSPHPPADLGIKRIYAAYAAADGMRVLVDRLWPRGVTTAGAHLDRWMKSLAPSADLRRRYHSGLLDATAFAQAYRQELAGESARNDALELLEQAEGRRLTLLYASKDGEQGHARILCSYLLDLASQRTH